MVRRLHRKCISQLYLSIVCLNCNASSVFLGGQCWGAKCNQVNSTGEREESVTLIFTLAAATQICSKPAASCNPDLLHTNVLNPHKNNDTKIGHSFWFRFRYIENRQLYLRMYLIQVIPYFSMHSFRFSFRVTDRCPIQIFFQAHALEG